MGMYGCLLPYFIYRNVVLLMCITVAIASHIGSNTRNNRLSLASLFMPQTLRINFHDKASGGQTQPPVNETPGYRKDLNQTLGSAELIEADDRDKRFFLLGFSNLLQRFVQVRNVPCSSATGNNGTCYRQNECTRLGGTGGGACSNGNGVCCVFLKSCGTTTNQNCTYFVNDGYPNAFDSMGSCQMMINKMNSDICQLRLDFDEFSIAGPDADTSVCTNDRFTVSSSSSSVPVICGINTGNHMYVNLGTGVTTPTILSFVTIGPSFTRKWKVKVSQIPCNAAYTAPTNCLQYYTGITGRIQTYNYNAAQGRQLANQDYTSCVRTANSFCGIQYTACDDPNPDSPTNPLSFSLSSQGGSTKGPTCNADWLIIPCVRATATDTTGACDDRFCGQLLNPTSTSGGIGNAAAFTTVKPFTLVYHTNDAEGSGEGSNRGYCLNYVQQPCI